MTLRRKFILALVSMVIFMAILSGLISLLSVNILLNRSVSYIQQGITNQWNRYLTSYYEEHQTWEGLQKHIIETMENPQQRGWGLPRENVRILVLSLEDKVVASSFHFELGQGVSDIRKGEELKAKTSPIKVNDEIVGYQLIEDNFTSRTDFVSRTLYSSIIKSMIVGLIITFLTALILGVFLSRRLTEPLKRLTQAVTSVGQGNLSTKIEPEGSSDIVALTEAFNKMTEQLVSNEEVRSKMVADIAHELRTPLTVISGKLESIQEGVMSAAPENILPIQDEVIRMTRLVRDLQHLSLAEAGKLPLVMREVDVEKLIRRILEHLELAIQEKNIKVIVTGQALPIEGDTDRLTQVFVNLIDNAIRHTPEGGFCRITFDTVSLKDGSAQAGLSVSIEDSGEGISEEDLPRVFDRFYRVDSARDRSSGGSGLGLAIAREFIQAHGGRLAVSSKIGEGTRFSVWLATKRS